MSGGESATCFKAATLVAALREKLKEARARLGRKRRDRKWLLEVLAERVLESTADALAMAELDSRRRRGQAGSSEDTEKRNRREREREGKEKRELVLKRRNGGVRQHRRGQ